MKWIAFIIASIQAVSSCVGAKDLIVPQEFSTIQAAIDASQATDTVIVKAGTYDESISLKSGVTIRGEDRPNTVVRCSSLESPVVRATGCTDATLTNLTLTHTDANQVLPDKAESFAVVFINAATIDVNGCHIHQAGDCGVLVAGRGNTSISNCIIENSRTDGIMVRGTGAVPTLQNNTCSKNMRHGIFFLSGAKGTAEQNTCSENGHFGIIAYGEGTQPTLVANRCSNNARTGMVFWDVDGGLADKNVCSSNGRHGIAVADGPSKPRILHNTCANNAGAGIYCPHFCNAVVANNYISDNAEIGSRQVRNLLYKRKYAELEQMAARLRTRKYRFIDGNWQLVDFYKSLAYSYGSKETFEDAISTRRLDEWIKQNPESSTPWIAKAEAYTYLAWRARTGNFAAEVLAQNWKGFREKLLLAKEALAKAENLKPKDPHLYSVYLSTAMGLNAPDLVSEHLFNMGVSIEPGYLPLYYARAIALLPRWGGQQGALKAFASKAVERFEPGEADALYTRIAHAVLLYAGPRSTKDHDFSYERIKRGYPSILKAYPKATGYLDGYCAFACLNKDKKLARDLFEQIGEDWSQACWDTAKCFSSYKAWAFMD